MLDTTHKLIKRVGKKIGLKQEDIQKLLKINSEFVFTIKLSNGSSHQAFRIQHNNARGPYKGGIRFHPDVDLNEVRALATLMSMKTAAIGLPLGGGKGGVAINPREITDQELEEIARAYVKHLHPHIGPDKDIPAPDVNTNPQIIDWMVDEYSKITGDKTKAAFTGKSVQNGGSKGRDAATGRGGVLALETFLKHHKLDKTPLTYAIQGFGNVGLYFGTIAAELLPNLELVAATDSSGGISSPFGLVAEELATYKKTGAKLVNYSGDDSVIITNEQLITEEVDILVLAALGDVITEANAKKVNAKIILELANGPVSDEADALLNKKGITIIPDILANAGGVIVSYLEWQQNHQKVTWDEEEVNAKLHNYLVPAVEASMKLADDNKSLNLKEAALAIAMRAILEA